MKKCFTLVLFLGILLFQSAKADNVSGTISVDSTWDLAGSPYIVEGTIIVEAGATLSIDSGVVVRFQSNLGMEIRGGLDAYKCTFTSDATTPSRGDWNEIRIGNDSEAGNALFQGCIIEYGGHATSDDSYGMVWVERGTATFQGSNEVARSNNAGIAMGSNGVLDLSGTVISANSRPISYQGPGSVLLGTGNNLTGNTQDVMLLNFTQNSNTLVLDSANIPYAFADEYTIASGGILQVDSGNVILMHSRLRIRGTLNAYFSRFTSSASPRAKGDWDEIEIGFSSDAGEANFWGCTIEYGGYSGVSASYAMLTVNIGTLNLYDQSIVRRSNNVGIEISASGNANLTNAVLSENTWPISYVGAGSLIFNQTNDLTGNEHDGILVRFSNLNTSFLLDTIDVPYYFYSYFTVQNGSTLEIASGNIIKLASQLYIDGTLIAVAGTDDHIYFTTYEDDNLGGDTNDDGTATTPNSRDWGSIHFRSASDDATCILKRCVIRYGGSGNHGGVRTTDASPTIDSCEFANNYYGAEFEGLSNPNFRYNLIASSDMVPIAMSFDADPVFLNNTFSFSDNEYDAIGLLGGTLAKNAVLKQRDVTGIPNVTYLMLGRLTIPETFSLTINKGIVIKGYSSNHRIVVKGALIADGEDASNRIVITSSKDDNHGNPMDTNKDGTQSEPDPGDWGGIVFEGTSADTCLLNYGQFKYARLPSTYYNTRYIYGGTINTVNASPTITNCIINNTDYAVYAFQASNPVIENNEISNTRYTPIALSVSADPSFAGNTFINTGQTALGLIGEDLGFDGTIRLRNVAGYDSISYVLLEDLTINSGTYVDVEAGVVIKMNRYTDIFVNGGFQAAGTASDTTVFTSIRDDNYGNPKDTEDDGDATSPSSGDWGNIRFQSTSDDAYNALDYCLLLYGGNSNNGIVTFSDAGGEISNTLLSDSYYYGLRCEGTASPVCTTNVEIRNCRQDPIAMSLKSNPVFSFSGMNIKSNGNGSNGIRILEGTLSSDATLSKRDVGGIYNIAYIVDRLDIASDATLTVMPGVVIKFLNYYSRIDVDGALAADGTPGENVVFTSLKDDSKGGDTNDDGNASTPEKGDWWCIVFNASDRDTANLLDNCTLNYGGRDQSGWIDRKDYGTIRFFNAQAEVDSCRIEQAHTSAIGVFGSADPSITHCDMHNINRTPVTMSMFASPSFSNNVVSNLGIIAIGIAQETYALDATIPKRDFAGYTNITYFIYRTCTVNSGTILTIPEGVVFKMDNIDCFDVDGAVLIKGSESTPVVFTHEHDDDYGNPMDTNEDGDESAPSIGYNNYHLDFADISNDTSTIRHAIFRYTQAGINLRQASPKIKRSRFEHTNWGVILNGVSHPALDTNTFHNLTYAPMQISLVSYPVSTLENVISGSTYKAIGVIDEELVQDVTLPQRTFAGVENIPYYFAGDYTIGTSVVLTIDPGVVLKFNDYSQVDVNRGLIAEGGSTADSTIVFTSIRDDFYGGDSNSDGDATAPGGSYQRTWDGIVFDNQALDNLCRLDHCVIRYAGWYDYESAIITQSASPTITHSTLTLNSNGVRAQGASNPVINYCDIYDSRYYGVNNVNQSFTIDARYNWWGNNTGPTHSGNPGGTGDEVSDMVDYSDFRTGSSNPAMGDVSLNGYVQAYDASLILQDVAELIDLTTQQAAVADVSDEGGITAFDASLILQYVSGNIDVFPAELKKGVLFTQPAGGITFEVIEEIPDEEMILALKIDQVTGVSAFGFEMEYNPQHWDVTSMEKTGLTKDMTLVHNVQGNTGKAWIAMAGAREIQEDGAILYITFSQLHAGTSEIHLTLNQALANETNIFAGPQPFRIQAGALGMEDIGGTGLSDLYPNPSSGIIHLDYSVEGTTERVQISLYDILGSRVADLLNEQQGHGYHSFTTNLREKADIGKGIYYIRLTIGSKTRVHKLIVQ